MMSINFQNLGFDLGWVEANMGIIVLGTIVFIQWIALQIFVAHYWSFRKSLRRPRPDGIRMNMLEKAVALQSEQLDKVYLKLADLRREMSEIPAATPSRPITDSTSVEASYVSLGEMDLKRRLNIWRGQST